jgi:hypothetical protein
MNSEAILENVRRYRAIASLYRQTAAFRPLQSCSLLAQAEEWSISQFRSSKGISRLLTTLLSTSLYGPFSPLAQAGA